MFFLNSEEVLNLIQIRAERGRNIWRADHISGEGVTKFTPLPPLVWKIFLGRTNDFAGDGISLQPLQINGKLNEFYKAQETRKKSPELFRTYLLTAFHPRVVAKAEYLRGQMKISRGKNVIKLPTWENLGANEFAWESTPLTLSALFHLLKSFKVAIWVSLSTYYSSRDKFNSGFSHNHGVSKIAISLYTYNKILYKVPNERSSWSVNYLASIMK